MVELPNMWLLQSESMHGPKIHFLVVVVFIFFKLSVHSQISQLLYALFHYFYYKTLRICNS